MLLKFCWISGHTNINVAQTQSNSKYFEDCFDNIEQLDPATSKCLVFSIPCYFELTTISLWFAFSVIAIGYFELISNYFLFPQRVQNSRFQLYLCCDLSIRALLGNSKPSFTLQRSLNGNSCDQSMAIWFCFIVFRENQPSGETSILRLLLAQTCTYLEDEVGLPGICVDLYDKIWYNTIWCFI